MAIWKVYLRTKRKDGTYEWVAVRRRFQDPRDAQAMGDEAMAAANRRHPHRYQEGHVIRTKVMQTK